MGNVPHQFQYVRGEREMGFCGIVLYTLRRYVHNDTINAMLEQISDVGVKNPCSSCQTAGR